MKSLPVYRLGLAWVINVLAGSFLFYLTEIALDWRGINNAFGAMKDIFFIAAICLAISLPVWVLILFGSYPLARISETISLRNAVLGIHFGGSILILFFLLFVFGWQPALLIAWLVFLIIGQILLKYWV